MSVCALSRGALWLIVGWLGIAPLVAQGQTPEAKPDRWEAAIKEFETQDAAKPPVPGGNLFIGSSSIRLWRLAESFPGHPCVNRGFGGSQLPDSVRYAERIVLPHRPKVIVLYAGDNDLAAKRTPEQVRDAYVDFVAKIRKALPETKIVWVSIKPSPKRWAIHELGQQANALVKAAQQSDPNSVSVDVWTPFLGSDGTPRRELFVKDELHLSPAGYEIWATLVRPHLVKTAGE